MLTSLVGSGFPEYSYDSSDACSKSTIKVRKPSTVGEPRLQVSLTSLDQLESPKKESPPSASLQSFGHERQPHPLLDPQARQQMYTTDADADAWAEGQALATNLSAISEQLLLGQPEDSDATLREARTHIPHRVSCVLCPLGRQVPCGISVAVVLVISIIFPCTGAPRDCCRPCCSCGPSLATL
jgi:hypothetical protein